ncbi:MAG: hypothetical protein V1898_05160 [Patescibacteria group bacterium]
MDIDFLKQQHKKTDEKPNNGQSFDIEYSKPQKSLEPKIKESEIIVQKLNKAFSSTAKTPPPAPVVKAVKDPNKKSWWQNFLDSFKSKPSEKKLITPQLLKPQKQTPPTITKKVFKPTVASVSKAPVLAPAPVAPVAPVLVATVQPVVPAPLPVQPITAVVDNPLPAPQSTPQTAPILPAEPVSKLSQIKDAGVYSPPKIVNNNKIKSLSPQDINKIKSGELSKGFLDVNLLPDDLIAELRPTTKIRALIFTAIFTIILMVLVYALLMWYQTTLLIKVTDTQSQIKLIEQQIVSSTEWQQEALVFNQQVKDIADLLDKKIYWTSFFTALENATLPDVHYATLNGSVDGTFTLSASAPSYEAVSRQIAAFQQASFVESVNVTSADMSAETESSAQAVSFNITLTVKPEVFYTSNQL